MPQLGPSLRPGPRNDADDGIIGPLSRPSPPIQPLQQPLRLLNGQHAAELLWRHQGLACGIVEPVPLCEYHAVLKTFQRRLHAGVNQGVGFDDDDAGELAVATVRQPP
jgi:hypothetical protein